MIRIDKKGDAGLMNCKIIAEAGVNHNGCLNTALLMIDMAAEAGADYIKFQTFKTENLVSRNAPKAAYQKSSTNASESQYEMLKRLELGHDDHLRLMKRCQRKHIEFLSTPFDLASVALLDDLGLETFKIPSGELTNLPYLRAIGKLNKTVFLSTGMATFAEVAESLQVLVDAGTAKGKIILLHANTEYPTPFKDANLMAMVTMAHDLRIKTGYSDHTLGIEVPIAAVALGACIIEKHFTLDCQMAGPDHKASVEPHELKAMIAAIRHVEKALGDGVKRVSPSEQKNVMIARKSIVASRAIKSGDLFLVDNLAVKRPGNGISPMKWEQLLGRVAQSDYAEDEVINNDELQSQQ
jgi:N,N'-diacetyllegionaminate synthase